MVPKTAWLQTFFRISSFVFRTNTFIQVWNYYYYLTVLDRRWGSVGDTHETHLIITALHCSLTREYADTLVQNKYSPKPTENKMWATCHLACNFRNCNVTRFKYNCVSHLNQIDVRVFDVRGKVIRRLSRTLLFLPELIWWICLFFFLLSQKN